MEQAVTGSQLYCIQEEIKIFSFRGEIYQTSENTRVK